MTEKIRKTCRFCGEEKQSSIWGKGKSYICSDCLSVIVDIVHEVTKESK